MTNLILPTKTKRELARDGGKDMAVGLSPWAAKAYPNDDDIVPKSGRWEQYYQMYQRHSIVRSAIDKIAKTATNVGYDFVPRDSRSKMRKGELRVLQDFFLRQRDFIYELRRVYKDLLIYGDSFMYIVPDRSGKPHHLKRLAPWNIAVRAAENGDILGYVQFDPNDLSKQNYVSFAAHEIMHFRIDDPNNDLYGLSPLASLEWAVAADIYAQQYNASFFQNSGMTGTIVAVRGISKEEAARNRKFLMENYTGPQAAHKPLFLEGEHVSVEKSVATHNEMGFLEGRKFIILEILAVLDVPPAKIGIMESANRSNSKEQDKSFRAESVSPLQYIVESVINAQFIQPILGVEHTIFVHSEGDTRDQIESMDYYTKGIDKAVFNVNEVRAKMGLAPVEGGDVNGIMTPTGFVPLDRMNLFFAPPQMNTDRVPPVASDPPEGEPMPKPTTATDVATGVSREAVKSMYDAAYEGTRVLFHLEEPTPKEIVKALTYFDEAKDADNHFVTTATLLRRAKACEDTDLQLGYIERAKDTMHAYIAKREDAVYENV